MIPMLRIALRWLRCLWKLWKPNWMRCFASLAPEKGSDCKRADTPIEIAGLASSFHPQNEHLRDKYDLVNRDASYHGRVVPSSAESLIAASLATTCWTPRLAASAGLYDG
jgi:hypothetical protein